MTKEEPKSKPKKVKKLKKGAEAVGDRTSPEVSPGAAESYVAGEIAGSLFSKKPTQSSSTLASLFDTKSSSVQPLYVPVVLTKAKRKIPETEDKEESKASCRTSEKETKKPKKELTAAEKKVAHRESALANADEDEKSKNSQAKKSRKSPEEEELPLHIKRRIIRSEEKKKNRRTIFVGNLPVSCTKQMLKACFKDFGQIESMRFRSMARADSSLSKKVATIQRKIHPNRKNINAYVLFRDQESASKALVKNGTEIASGFHIRVDLASKSSSHDNKKSAFVGNLPYDVEEEDLRNHFSECGNVEAVRIIRDQKTGIGKGFGYVLFQSVDAVQLALKLNNSDLMGRKIRVKHCTTSGPQNPKKDVAFNQKPQSLRPGKLKKKNSFAGKTADATKKKNKRPSNKKNIK